MMFGSVFGILGQVLYNEIGVQRIKFISRRYLIPSQLPTSTVSGLAEPPMPKQPLRRIAELEAQLEEDKNSKNS
jgi:hypothetical protein